MHLARAGYSFPPIYASKGTLELVKAALNEAGVDLCTTDWSNKFKEVEIEKIRQKNFWKSKQKNNNKQANTNDLSGFKQNKRLR